MSRPKYQPGGQPAFVPYIHTRTLRCTRRKRHLRLINAGSGVPEPAWHGLGSTTGIEIPVPSWWNSWHHAIDRKISGTDTPFRGNSNTVKLTSIEAIFRALNAADVEYLIAGGLAVNAHGYLRFTKDVDFVLRLVPDNIEQAFSALGKLGYRPNVPVTAQQFADPEQRQSWIRDKGMQVLQLWSDQHEETPIDIFVTEPFPYDEEYALALVKPLYGDVDVRFVSIPTLIRMKEAAGRQQDQIDIEHLRLIMENNHDRKI